MYHIFSRFLQKPIWTAYTTLHTSLQLENAFEAYKRVIQNWFLPCERHFLFFIRSCWFHYQGITFLCKNYILLWMIFKLIFHVFRDYLNAATLLGLFYIRHSQGTLLKFSRDLHESWDSHGTLMVLSWYSHGTLMGLSWDSSRTLVVLSLDFSGLLLKFLRNLVIIFGEFYRTLIGLFFSLFSSLLIFS